MQFIRDLRDVTGVLKELVADDARHEEDAKLELTVSAQRFSHETREVVDDKLSFSATLMRAGEVEAANRLLAEVEAQVRDNEAALFEQVNEVKVARAARRERITRMRLARSLAVAMLGAAVMATSAAGMAFASFLEDRARAAAATQSPERARRDAAETAAAARARVKQARMSKVRKAGVARVAAALSPKALAAFEQLQSGDVPAHELEHLLSLLPDELADTMRQALTTVEVAENTVKDVIPELAKPSPRKKPAKDQEPADATPKEDPAEEKPGDDPSPDPDPSSSPEPEEEPEEDPDDSTGLPDLDG
jgi:hypothetical protein